jgi:hypothetical protein
MVPQSALQPSPATVFPSSQDSPALTTLSPQTIVERQIWPVYPASAGGVVHWQFDSSLQLPLQQSPGIKLPSSHCSPGSKVPLPHVLFNVHTLPTQVYPLSVWQVAEQPSPETVFPSSQDSPYSALPFPQTGAAVVGVHSLPNVGQM